MASSDPASNSSMTIDAIYIHPLKSFRPTSVTSTPLLPTGLPYDRRFALLRDHGPGVQHPRSGTSLSTMHVSEYPQMCLFTTCFLDASGSETTDAALAVSVRANHPGTDACPGPHELIVPLHPDVSDAPDVFVRMHTSAGYGKAMPKDMSAFFTAIFGFKVIFAYLPPSNIGRPVLGNVAPDSADFNAAWTAARAKPNAVLNGKRKRDASDEGEQSWARWVGVVLRRAVALGGASAATTPISTPVAGEAETEGAGDDEGYASASSADESMSNIPHRISFADIAPYMFASATSVAAVESRIATANAAAASDKADHVPTVVDVTKFRPNIVVGGAATPFEEDYWGEVSTCARPNAATGDEKEVVKFTLTTNCVRCPSLNVDYATGRASGRMLQALQRDRRVDPAHRWSPVFGRYAFLSSSSSSSQGAGKEKGEKQVLRVGDRVEITRTNAQRSSLLWPGMGKTAKGNLFPVAPEVTS